MEINADQLKEDLDKALALLSEGKNLQLMEDIVNLFVNQSRYNVFSYVTLQVQLAQNFEENTGIILAILKGQVTINNYQGRYKEAYRRLAYLSQISNIHINNAEKAISLPDHLSNVFFSFNEVSPFLMLMILTNNNGDSYRVTMDFNSALNLVNTTLSNLIQQLSRSNKDISLDLINQFRENSGTLTYLIDQELKKQDENNE